MDKVAPIKKELTIRKKENESLSNYIKRTIKSIEGLKEIARFKYPNLKDPNRKASINKYKNVLKELKLEGYELNELEENILDIHTKLDEEYEAVDYDNTDFLKTF